MLRYAALELDDEPVEALVVRQPEVHDEASCRCRITVVIIVRAPAPEQCQHAKESTTESHGRCRTRGPEQLIDSVKLLVES